jgi:hypothetical protein
MTTAGYPVRRKIADVASSMLDGPMDLLEGCRTIVRLRGNLSDPDLYDPDLLFLVAVESELDDVPVGTARQHWAPEALAEKDEKKSRYLATAQEEIQRSCRALITRWATDVQSGQSSAPDRR